ncbi:Hypothetical predicted protein [Paramuricea clavata]|uniref:Uncharacterized protein n=1 Tax=Paramuricea clavata TaxID=317549 RepID=A0A7D9K0E2_PARCT|nr:Hypothetical predicted protein [Paramuricea clavata]
MTTKRCRCPKKERGRRFRRFGKRDVEENPRRSYRWYMKSSLHRKESKKLDNYGRHLKKESSAKYYKKMSAKSFQDQWKRLNSRIQASQKRLSELRSKKKSLTTMMYRETSKPQKKTTCRCVNGKAVQYEKVKINQKIPNKKLSKKERKRLYRIKKKGTCKVPAVNCFLHTNHHWKTEPLWKSRFKYFLSTI